VIPESIVCPICSLPSHDQMDVEQRYCRRCRVFWGDVLDRLDHEGGDVVETIRFLPLITDDAIRIVALATWLLMDKRPDGAGHVQQPIPGSAPS
jgi:hypothetical protein